MQDRRLAEEIALKEHITESDRLTKFLFRFDFLCEQTDVTGEYVTHFLTLFRIFRDAKIHLDDVRHLNERLIAGHEDEVVERDLVTVLFELSHRLHNLRRRLYGFQNLHDNAFRREELRRTVQQVLLGEIDECLPTGDQFFHAEFQHGTDHDALRRYIAVQRRVIGILETAAEKDFVCVYFLLLIEYGLSADEYFFHRRTFLYAFVVISIPMKESSERYLYNALSTEIIA